MSDIAKYEVTKVFYLPVSVDDEDFWPREPELVLMQYKERKDVNGVRAVVKIQRLKYIGEIDE